MSEHESQTPKPSYPREPQAYPGGSQEMGGLTPPYEGRQTTGKSDEQRAQERNVSGTSEAGPRQVSQAEREGITSTDPNPSGPHGVGESTTTSGEDYGRSMSPEERRDDRFDAGISSEGNVDPQSPPMQTGDQGG